MYIYISISGTNREVPKGGVWRIPFLALLAMTLHISSQQLFKGPGMHSVLLHI